MVNFEEVASAQPTSQWQPGLPSEHIFFPISKHVTEDLHYVQYRLYGGRRSPEYLRAIIPDTTIRDRGLPSKS